MYESLQLITDCCKLVELNTGQVVVDVGRRFDEIVAQTDASYNRECALFVSGSDLVLTNRAGARTLPFRKTSNKWELRAR
jgi:hypothetical protein